MKLFRKIVNKIYLFMTYLGIFLLLAMVAIVSINVFNRFFRGSSFGWADETALILMAWFSMISMALGVKMKLHISIEAFTMKLPDKIKKNVIQKLADICMLLFSSVLFYYGLLLVKKGMLSTLPGTGLPTSVEYLFVPIAGFMIIINSIIDLFNLDKDDDFDEIFMGGKENA